MRFWLSIIVAGAVSVCAAYAAEIEAVTSDIVRSEGKEYRIANIEAPQIDGSCPEERAFALQAKAKLTEFLAQGPAELQPTGGYDMQKRDTARVSVGGKDVGELMIKAGVASKRGYGRPLCFATVADDGKAEEPSHVRPDNDLHVGIARGQAPPQSLPPVPGGAGIRR